MMYAAVLGPSAMQIWQLILPHDGVGALAAYSACQCRRADDGTIV
jgi:hypothetical protein